MIAGERSDATTTQVESADIGVSAVPGQSFFAVTEYEYTTPGEVVASRYCVVPAESPEATTVLPVVHPASVKRLTENVPPDAFVPQPESDQLTVSPEAPHEADGSADQSGGAQFTTVVVATSSARESDELG